LKLNIVPASHGVLWVKQGMRAFIKQPLALIGLFFMFMAAMSIASLLPYVGSALALMLLPGATLGLMAATKESSQGKFPMPLLLVSAFRAGSERLRAMLTLGAMYAIGFLGVMAVSALFDGGQFALLYLVGGKITEEMMNSGDFLTAMWVAMALYLPLSMAFWHAPGLVHWHGVSPVKSLFFSSVACVRNMGAYTVYSLVWMGVFMLAGIVLTTIAAISGNAELLSAMLLPAAMVIIAMFFTSIYFTFADSFVAPDAPAPSDTETLSP
jgi:hypothetical protein